MTPQVPARRINWNRTLFLLVAPLVVAIGIPLYHIYAGFSASLWLAFIPLYICSGLAIGGYHRLFSHRAYEAGASVKLFYLLWGPATFANSALAWSYEHRQHHTHVDTDNDPYNVNRGFFFAHMGWLFYEEEEHYKNPQLSDLSKDPLVRWQHRNYMLIAGLMSTGLPMAIGLYLGRPGGAFLILVLLRILLIQHSVFLVNSAAHYFGKKTYSTANSSRDGNFLMGMITFGEGYHNFHHTFPSDYRNGHRWFHWDPTKWSVWLLSWVGLTRDLRRTPKHKLQEARDRAGA